MTVAVSMLSALSLWGGREQSLRQAVIMILILENLLELNSLCVFSHLILKPSAVIHILQIMSLRPLPTAPPESTESLPGTQHPELGVSCTCVPPARCLDRLRSTSTQHRKLSSFQSRCKCQAGEVWGAGRQGVSQAEGC